MGLPAHMSETKIKERLAVAEGETPASESVHKVAWFTAADVAEQSDIAEDLRIHAKDLFGRIADTAAR